MTSDKNMIEILRFAQELVRHVAHPKRGTIALPPELAVFFTSRATTAAEAGVPSASGGLAAFDPESPLTTTFAHVNSLDELKRIVAGCRKCSLCETRTQTVFSDGNATAQLVFVGEAPGEDEDRTGVPFVGKAGQLLTDIIVKGMKLRREDVYICNVIKCRPPNNRDPLPTEKEQCEPYLVRQLELLKPRIICALGGHAANTLLRKDEAVGRLRKKWHQYHGIPLRVTYHPAYLLRNPADKKLVWEDIRHVMRALNGEEDPRSGLPIAGSARPTAVPE